MNNTGRTTGGLERGRERKKHRVIERKRVRGGFLAGGKETLERRRKRGNQLEIN